MRASVLRVGDLLRIGTHAASVVTVSGVIGVVVLAALATSLGVLPILLGAGLLGLVTLISFRWPLVALAAFAALIPIEEVVLIEGLGTVSRFAGLLFAATYGLPRIGSLALGAMPAAVWAYVAWALLSAGWALDPTSSWAELPTLLQLFPIGLLVADFVVRRPEIIRPILWVYSLSSAATAAIGIAGYAGQGLGGDGRATAIQGQDPAQFAAVLVPALVFGLYRLLNGDRRILSGGIALITAIGVIVSGTRGAWLAVVVAIVLFILPQLSLKRRIAAVAMALAMIAMAYQLPGVPDLFAERTGTALSSGGAGRTDIWSVGLTIYRSAPVLGVGYANFPIAYTSEAVRATNLRSVSSALLQGRAPHNLAIGTLVELGPVGLLLIVLFLGPLVVQRGWGPDAAVVQTALASLVTLAMFLDVLANRKQVWLIIGMAAGLAYLARRERQSTPVGQPLLSTVGAEGTAGRRVLGRLFRGPTAPAGHDSPPR
jgi:O-antigen ligase